MDRNVVSLTQEMTLVPQGDDIRVQLRPQNWTHPEPHSGPVDQFLAMLRFEQRDKVADIISETELPIDLDRSGWDGFF